MSGQNRFTRRRLISVALGGMAAGVASACDDDDAPAVVTQAGIAAEPVNVATVLRGLSGSITVAYPDELGKKPPYVEQAAEAVRAAHPRATVRVLHERVSSGDFYRNLRQKLAAGDAPDVIHVAGERTGELADEGHLEPLDALLEGWQDWRYYPDTVRRGVSYRGKIWGLPYGLDTRFLYYRRDIFARAGLPGNWLPKSVDGLLEAAEAVKASVPDVLPYSLYAGAAGDAGTSNHGLVPLIWAYGGELQDASGRWIGESTALRKALTYYARAYAKGLVPPELLTTDRPWVEMRRRLGAGGLALLFEGGWVYGGWANEDRAGTERNVGYLLHPTEREGPSFTIGGAGTCWYISSRSQAKALAWEFIKAFNNRETVAKLNAEDPHPVARVDAIAVPEYRGQKFLVDSTNSLEKAKFVPPDADVGALFSAMQRATGRVATGEMTPDEATRRFTDDLRQTLGPDRVVSGL